MPRPVVRRWYAEPGTEQPAEVERAHESRRRGDARDGRSVASRSRAACRSRASLSACIGARPVCAVNRCASRDGDSATRAASESTVCGAAGSASSSASTRRTRGSRSAPGGAGPAPTGGHRRYDQHLLDPVESELARRHTCRDSRGRLRSPRTTGTAGDPWPDQRASACRRLNAASIRGWTGVRDARHAVDPVARGERCQPRRPRRASRTVHPPERPARRVLARPHTCAAALAPARRGRPAAPPTSTSPWRNRPAPATVQASSQLGAPRSRWTR